MPKSAEAVRQSAAHGSKYCEAAGVAQGGVVIECVDGKRRPTHSAGREQMKPLRQILKNRSAQDTFYVGNMKGVGRVYQQTFIDT
jgi:hypothetical protein